MPIQVYDILLSNSGSRAQHQRINVDNQSFVQIKNAIEDIDKAPIFYLVVLNIEQSDDVRLNNLSNTCRTHILSS